MAGPLWPKLFRSASGQAVEGDGWETGARVHVRQDPEFGPGPWPAEPTGTVRSGPEIIEGTRGLMATYWVQFDEPQYDTDGDGPYDSSQVLGKYLEPLSSGTPPT